MCNGVDAKMIELIDESALTLKAPSYCFFPILKIDTSISILKKIICAQWI